MKKNLFDKFPKFNLLMICICVATIIASILDGNLIVCIWAFNTAIWCAMEGEDCMKISELRDKISELLEEKYNNK